MSGRHIYNRSPIDIGRGIYELLSNFKTFFGIVSDEIFFRAQINLSGLIEESLTHVTFDVMHFFYSVEFEELPGVFGFKPVLNIFVRVVKSKQSSHGLDERVF